jgi:hypothetical protein
MDVVFATATTHVTTPGGARILVRKGSHWPASDPVVQVQPSLFSDDARYGMTYSVEPAGYDAPVGAPVEQATAAPGERRNRTRAS